MNSQRVFYVMIGVVCLATVLFFGGVFLGNKRLSTQASQLVQLKLEAQVVEAQQVALIQAKKEVAEYSELADIARTIVPQDKDQARTVLEINKIAEDSGIKLASISFASSNLGQAAPAAPQSEGTAGDETSSTPTAPPLTQVKPIDGISGVFSLEVVISPSDFISYNNLIGFLGRLENNRRTAHVSKIVINPNTKGGGLTFTLTLNAYVKP